MIKFKYLLVPLLAFSVVSVPSFAGVITSPSFESTGEIDASSNAFARTPGQGYYSVFGNLDSNGKGTSVIDLYAGCSLPSWELYGTNPKTSCDVNVNASSTLTYQFMVSFDDPDAAQAKLGSQFFSMFFDWSFGYQVDLDLRNTADRRWNSNGTVSVSYETTKFGRRNAQQIACDPLLGGCNGESSIVGDSYSGTRVFTDFGTLEGSSFDVQDDTLVTITMSQSASLYIDANNFPKNEGIFSVPASTQEARITSFLDPVISIENSISDLVTISDFTVASSFTEEGDNNNAFGGIQGVQNFELFNIPTRPSTDVSEPHTVAILALGLVGLLLRRRVI